MSLENFLQTYKIYEHNISRKSNEFPHRKSSVYHFISSMVNIDIITDEIIDEDIINIRNKIMEEFPNWNENEKLNACLSVLDFIDSSTFIMEMIELLPHEKLSDSNFIKTVIKYQYPGLIKYVIEKGIDIFFKNKDLALIVATYAIEYTIPFISLLLENGLDINANSMICHFVCRQQPKLVKFAIDNGADISANNNFPIKAAVYLKNMESLKYLLEAGVDISMDSQLLFNLALRNCDRQSLADKMQIID